MKIKYLKEFYTSCQGLDIKSSFHDQQNWMFWRHVVPLEAVADALLAPAYTSVQPSGRIEYFGFPDFTGRAVEVVVSAHLDGTYWPVVTSHPFYYRSQHYQKAGLSTQPQR